MLKIITPRIRRLRAIDITSYFSTVSAFEEIFQRPFDRLFRETDNIPNTITATYCDQVIGGVIYHAASEEQGVVRFIGVKERFRKSGIGGELLRVAEYEMTKDGRKEVFLETKTASWYEKRGYTTMNIINSSARYMKKVLNT